MSHQRMTIQEQTSSIGGFIGIREIPVLDMIIAEDDWVIVIHYEIMFNVVMLCMKYANDSWNWRKNPIDGKYRMRLL